MYLFALVPWTCLRTPSRKPLRTPLGTAPRSVALALVGPPRSKNVFVKMFVKVFVSKFRNLRDYLCPVSMFTNTFTQTITSTLTNTFRYFAAIRCAAAGGTATT